MSGRAVAETAGLAASTRVVNTHPQRLCGTMRKSLALIQWLLFWALLMGINLGLGVAYCRVALGPAGGAPPVASTPGPGTDDTTTGRLPEDDKGRKPGEGSDKDKPPSSPPSRYVLAEVEKLLNRHGLKVTLGDKERAEIGKEILTRETDDLLKQLERLLNLKPRPFTLDRALEDFVKRFGVAPDQLVRARLKGDVVVLVLYTSWLQRESKLRPDLEGQLTTLREKWGGQRLLDGAVYVLGNDGTPSPFRANAALKWPNPFVTQDAEATFAAAWKAVAELAIAAASSDPIVILVWGSNFNPRSTLKAPVPANAHLIWFGSRVEESTELEENFPMRLIRIRPDLGVTGLSAEVHRVIETRK